MKVAFFLCATFLVTFYHVKANPVGECSEGAVEFLPDDTDCNIFYQCSWGNPIKLNCPHGLHFNRELQVCDWPNEAGCEINGGEVEDGNSSESKSSSSSSESDESS